MKHKYHPYVPKWRPGQDVKKMRRRKARRTIWLILLLLVLLFIGWVAFGLLRPAGKSGKEGFIYIRPTTTMAQVETQLTQEIGLRNSPFMKLGNKLLRVERNLRPGRYAVTGRMSLVKLYRILLYLSLIHI